MKKLISLIALTLLSVCLLFMVSCAKTVDEVSNFKLDTDTLTLSWDMVLGAKDYTVSISGEEREKTTKKAKIELDYLDPGTYEIKVRANSSGEKKDSDWASYTFVREEESGLRYKLINNKTEYQLTGIGTASGDIVMDDTYRGKPVTSIADKAFSGSSKITSFVVGKYVKTIGKSAFAKCTELTSVTISDSVTSFGSSCFQSCGKLKTFTFPSSVTTVADYMFSRCYALETINFGNSIETVGTYAFSNCDSLTTVTFGDSLKFIDEYAFSSCKALTTANLGNSLETLGAYAFNKASLLSNVTLGASIKTIGEYAFAECSSIKSLTIPETCESISNYAFRYCTALEELKLPSVESALKYVGYGVVFNTKIYNNAENAIIIDGWYLYHKNKEEPNIALSGVHGIAHGTFNNCDSLINFDGRGVKYLCHEAFSSCDKLKYVYFDNNLESIGSLAFKGCKELYVITIGSKIKSIGDYAFSGCSKLAADHIYENDQNKATTTFPATLTEIGKDAFKGMNNVGSQPGVIYVKDWAVGYNAGASMGFATAPSQLVVKTGTRGIANYSFSEMPVGQIDYTIFGVDIADSVLYIGRGAFYKALANGYATTVKLPKSLVSIGDYAFYGAYGAYFGGMDRTLTIPANTTYVGRSAFYGCTSILTVNIPASVKEIAPYTFYGCVGIGSTFDNEDGTYTIGSLNFADGVTTIREKAFYGCTGIAYLNIPDSVTSIGARAFYKCTGIKELTIGAGVTEISDYAFYNCSLLEKVTMSDSVTSIGNYAFRGASALTTIKFSSSLKTIGNYAFFGAEYIAELVIPDGVTTIGAHAFRDMKRVHSIIIPASVTTINAHAFYGATTTTIYVEANASMDNWNVRWNSSFAPVITGCTLSSDNTYVESFVKKGNNPDNMPNDGSMYAPIRAGYEFLGFSTKQDGSVEYTTKNLSTAPSGKTLYTVWRAV